MCKFTNQSRKNINTGACNDGVFCENSSRAKAYLLISAQKIEVFH